MKTRILIVLLSLCGSPCKSTTVASAAGPIVVGPGPQPIIYETSGVDYHLLSGTQIVSPSEIGPPSNFVVVTDAIEMRGGGHTRIDGGSYRGGDAAYNGPNGSLATVAGGSALHLRHSSGEIYGGTFIGGDAFSNTWLGSSFAGEAVTLVGSTLSVFGGYFEGGSQSQRERVGGGIEESQAPSFVLYERSRLTLHGGITSGAIEIRGGRVSIVGTNIISDGTTVSGFYADGTPFSHSVVRLVVPEPSAVACITLTALLCYPMARPRAKRD